MRLPSRFSMGAAIALGVVILSAITASMQGTVVDPALGNLPNPNPTIIKNWAMLPDGRAWGSTAGVDIGPDGHVWAYDRCGANTCDGSMLPVVCKFDRSSGKLLASFGAGAFVFPHGLHVDRDGNVWLTDGQRSKDGSKGHQVLKFSHDGKVLTRLGKAGVAGRGPDTFNEPNDVVTAPNGDIFVSDGHSGQQDNPPPNANARIVKFSKDGKYVKEWGFDQNGKFIAAWQQFGRVSGIFIDRNNNFHAIDSESNPMRHPRRKTGVRIGTTNQDKVLAFIAPHDNGNVRGCRRRGSSG